MVTVMLEASNGLPQAYRREGRLHGLVTFVRVGEFKLPLKHTKWSVQGTSPTWYMG